MSSDKFTQRIGMENKHRQIILNHIDSLISKTKYEVLRQEFLKEGLLTKTMIRKIEDVKGIDQLDKEALKQKYHKNLFEKLTKRGPDAFDISKRIFLKCNYEEALQILLGDIDNNSYMSIKEQKRVSTVLQNSSIHRTTSPTTASLKAGSPIKKIGLRVIHELKKGYSKILKTKIWYFKNIEEDEGDETFKLMQYTGEICPNQQFEVIKSTKICKGDKVSVYEMKSKHNRGVLLVVNIISFEDKELYRRGANEDTQSLLKLFKEFGFKLYVFENLKKSEFFPRLNALLQSDDVRNAECFVMAFMSHGCIKENNDFVQFADGYIMDVNSILRKFSNDTCKNLMNTPKLFIFPFCRGEQRDFGHLNTQTDRLYYNEKPTLSDTIICYAAADGFIAHRDTEKGAWYIQSFCEHMAKHAHDTHLENILKIIQEEISNKYSERGTKQTGNYRNINSNKLLYFNPGYYVPCNNNSDNCNECAAQKK